MANRSDSPASKQLLEEVGLSNLPHEWEIVRIEELLSDDRGISVGVMYPGSHDPFGVPLIKSGDLANNIVVSQPEFKITRDKHIEYRRTALEGGELLLSLVGDVGRCAVVTSKMADWNVARAIAVLRFEDSSNAGFVRSCLLSAPVQHLLHAWSTTTVQATLNLKEIRQIPLPWPGEKERKRIAEVIGALDDKIEVNQKMSETLEAMSRALFKSWFVNFDPARAKAEGLDTGLPAHVAALFPDSFVDSELGEIPTSWSVKSIGDLVDFAYGKALKEAGRKPGNVAVYGSNGQIGWHDERLAEGPGIIVGRKGNPGIVTWVPTDFFAIDTTFYVVPRGECRSLYFLYFALKGHDLASLGADSAVPGLNRNMAYLSKQLVPPPALLEAFDQQIRPLFERIQKSKVDSSSLAQMRDALLPKLISGEIRLATREHNEGKIR